MDRRGFDLLNKQAMARTAQGEDYGAGEVIAYCMVRIRCADGTSFWWRVDLCRFTADQEDVVQDVVE